MNSRRFAPGGGLLLLAWTLLGWELGHAAAPYTFNDLGVLPGHTRSEPTAINNQGAVIGLSMVPGTLDFRAFVYRDGRMTGLSLAGWDATQAADVNDEGQVLVNAFRPDPLNPGLSLAQPFVVRNGLWTDLPNMPPWRNALGHGLNASGVVVGEHSDGTNTFAFRWADGIRQTLGSATALFTNAAAYAINRSGQILMADQDGTYLLQGPTRIPIALPGNGNWSLQGLNDRGQVVGHFEVDIPGDPSDPDGSNFSQRHAFLWQGGRLTDLSPTNALDSIAMDINAHGQPVGYCILVLPGAPFPEPRAVLFQAGGALDLNTVLPPGNGWKLTYATAINDLGQIACIGTSPSNTTHAVLLTPPFASLTPDAATNQVGQTHEVTFSVVSNSVPIRGITVRFEVVSGPNQGAVGTTATAVTDAQGEATFRYTGAKGGGTDRIEARAELGPLQLVAAGECTWEAGIELRPRLVIGCPGGSADLELIDLATGRNIAADPTVEFEWVGDDFLSNLAWKALEKALPSVAGKRAALAVRQGRVSFLSQGFNLLNARRRTDRGDLESNYALVAVGVLELSTLDSIEIGPLSAVNLAQDTTAGRIASALGVEFPIRSPMILFPESGTPCGGLLQKLGTTGFVELRSVKFNLLGGLITDVDLMKAVGPLVGLASKAFPLAWLADGLSTRAAQVGAAQLLEFEVTQATADPDADNPFIDLAEDNSEFPYIRGRVSARKSGVAVVQAKLDLQAYCLGEATDLMWVWVLPDLEKVEIRNAQGRLERDPDQLELPLPVWVNQSTQAVAVARFRNFAEAGRIPIGFDPLGIEDSGKAKLAEKLLPGYAKIQDRVGISIPIRYPPGAEAGPGGLYEQGTTAFSLTVTYLPLVPALRVDEFQLQVPLWNGFNTWALNPATDPHVRLDAGQALLTGLAPGLAQLRVDACVAGLSRASDTAQVRILAGDPVCTVRPAALALGAGQTTSLEATVTVDGLPAPPAEVDFMVMSGPNAGLRGSDLGPVARFSYAGNGGPGTDVIEVVTFAWGRICGASATRTWTNAAPLCVLTPAAASRPVDTMHAVEARVTVGGQPVSGATVHFLVSSGPNAGSGAAPSTDASGLARFTYPGLFGPGTDLVEATGLAGSAPFGGSATVTWTNAPAEPSADLAVTQSVHPPDATVGENLVFSIRVANLGPDPATAVSLTDTLSPGLEFVSISGSPGGCAGTGPIGCAIGTLAPGASATITLVARAVAPGTAENRSAVSAHERDPATGNNAAATRTPVRDASAGAAADLAVTVSHVPATSYPGHSLTSRVTVRNLGPARATGVTVSHALAGPARFESATPSQGGVRGLNPFAWDLGPLASNAIATLQLVVRPLRPGPLDATATVAGAEPDPLPSNNRATDPISVSQGPAILRLTPEAAPPGVDGLELRIEGAGFAPGASLGFQPGTGIESWDEGTPDFGFLGPDELRRMISIDPGAPPGVHEVFVTNPGGAAGGGLPFGRFTILAPNQPTPRPDGMARWLTGDGTPGDLAGGAPGALLRGATATAPGKVGQAFGFDGVDDAVDWPLPGSAFTGAQPITLELWVYPDAAGDGAFLLGKQEGCDPARLQFRLGMDLFEGVVFETARGFVSSGSDLPPRQWTHLAVTSDRGELALYVDGFLVGLGDGELGPATAAPLRLGGCGTCPGAFAGRLDEVTLYSRALSDGEVQALAAAGAAGKSKALAAPVLEVWPVPGSTALQLTWPASAADHVLEETAAIGPGAVWLPAVTRPTTSGAQVSVLLGPDRGTRFYRLTRP